MAALAARRPLGDGYHPMFAADYFAKDRIPEVAAAVIEEVIVGQVDEELAGGAVTHLGTSHGNGVAIVLQAIIRFVLDRLADGTLAHVRIEAAALDHESGNDAVEDQAVIMTSIGIAQEV